MFQIRRNYNSNFLPDDDDWDKSDTSSSTMPSGYNNYSPRVGDDVDHLDRASPVVLDRASPIVLDRASPIVLDSDGVSIVESPVPNPKTHEYV